MSYSVYMETFALIVMCFVYLHVSAGAKGEKKKKTFRALCALAFCVFAAILLYLAIFKRAGHFEQRSLSFVPFSCYHTVLTVYNSFDSYKLILDNILVFVPFGMLFPNLPGKNQKHKLLISAAAGMAFSVMIESVQYAFSLGCTELDDVINNTIGTIVGCGIFALGEKISRNGKKTVLQPGWQKSLIPAAAVCAVMFFMDVYREYILFGKM